MKAKISIINLNASIYRKSNKKQKSILLDELSQILHLNRKYIAYLLRNSGKTKYLNGKTRIIADPKVNKLSKRGRKKVYGQDMIKPLVEIWKVSGFVSSKHLAAFIRLNIDKLSKILDKFPPQVKEKLLKISASTIDRLLEPIRKKMKLKDKYRRNPFSSNLKRSIEVESWFDKSYKPGYVEIDLVHHSGASGKGDFIYTLTATEITTGWTELRALKNKAMVWTIKALKDIIEAMPIEVKKIHSDNGTEFVNYHVQKLCKEMGIEFTRSRPYRKNDAPYVESKNWSLVRAHTGWRRYDTEEELEILDKLLRLASLRHNLFMPTMKLVLRERIGCKVRKQYKMDTPFNRIISMGVIPEEEIVLIKDLRESIDLVQLSKEIERLTDELANAYMRKLRRYTHE